jgi:hypothetical protein
MDCSALLTASALTLRVFFVTGFVSVPEVAMTTKLQLLLEKETQLKAQIQLAKAAERTLEKKKDTRRKILIGAAVLAKVEAGMWPQQDLKVMMDGFLTRPHERELFGLDTAEGAISNGKAGGDLKVMAKTEPKVSGEKKSKRAAKGRSQPLPEKSVDVINEFNL